MNFQWHPFHKRHQGSIKRLNQKPAHLLPLRLSLQTSLRTKLLLGFSIVFSVVFAGAFYWFYTFTTDRALSRLRANMQSTLTGAAAGTNVEELLSLYQDGKRNAAGFSDDPRYHNQLAWFQSIHRIEPTAWLYSYIVAPSAQNRRVGSPAAKPNELEIIYLVDLWSAYDPAKSTKFLEPDQAGGAAHEIVRDKRLVEEAGIYTDKWGTWLSAAAPLLDEDGNLVAVLGLDIEASYVLDAQEAIRDRVVASFIVTYSILFVLIYALSGILTKRLSELTESAKQISEGDYDLDLSFSSQRFLTDEMATLANVFESMVTSIRTREQQIREGKQIEYEIRIALQQERELNELKSRFVSMVSHELRTPLTVIRTSLELLQRYGHIAPDEKKQEYFQRCQAAIHNMNQLLGDVLTIGKAEAGKLDFSPTWLDLQQFCHDVVEDMQMDCSTSHLIAFQYQGEGQSVCVDKTLLRSILTNLLSNAIKYSPAGSTIAFEVDCSNQIATFEIQDAGIGIPLADQARLFELFHRASNVSTIRGTGLGLAIVKQCVIHHKGQITFCSQEGVGTTFTVKLPLDLTGPTQLQPELEANPEPA